jgi:hypothetical protein
VFYLLGKTGRFFELTPFCSPSLSKRGGEEVSFQDVIPPKLKRGFFLSKIRTTKLEKKQKSNLKKQK